MTVKVRVTPTTMFAPPVRINNFDLIRLGAASQVMLDHAFGDLKVGSLGLVHRFLSYLPGVPIFFVISGFLISMSWERAPSFRQYSWNRVLRIYPALWVCLAVSVGVVLLTGIRPKSPMNFVTWIAAQITVFQFYNPDFLRGFGVGVLNGSLWTIPVELEFYMLLPLLAMVAKNRQRYWVGLAIAALILMFVARLVVSSRETVLQKLIGVTIIPYLFYFVVGTNARYLYQKWPEVFRGKAIYWAAIYVAWAIIETTLGLSGQRGPELNPVSILLLAMLIVSLAFSLPKLAFYLLHQNDISYGVYIYHMLLVNLLVWGGVVGMRGFGILVFGTIALAWVSWRVVERPALRLKHYSLRRTA